MACICFAISYSQNTDLPKIIKDTLFTSCGYKIVEDENVKIGSGSMPDGDFKYIRINSSSLFAYNSTSGNNTGTNQANSFGRGNSGHSYKVSKVEERGNKKHGYVYYIKISTGLIKYEVDVENAIASGELSVPAEFKQKPASSTVVEIKQQFSVADELAKLKKLYSDSVLTKEEYESQKKKILEKQ